MKSLKLVSLAILAYALVATSSVGGLLWSLAGLAVFMMLAINWRLLVGIAVFLVLALPLLELYRRPTGDNRSLLTLAPGELVVGVRLPARPDASAYERLGERAAFSFPLVSVAAARRGSEARLVAAGVANVPRELDPADPLAGLPGHPQTGWKRRALETLVGRALSALG